MSKENIIAKHEKELSEFQAWTMTQPRLPKKIDLILLLRHLKTVNFDLEKAKDLLISNLETRKKFHQLFLHRDILSDEFQLAMNTFQNFDLPKNTKENFKITIFRLNDPDYKNFSVMEILRMLLMMVDARLVDWNENGLDDGIIAIVDVPSFGIKHMTQLIANISAARDYSFYSQSHSPVQLIKIHFINCPPILQKLLSALNPFLNEKVRDSFKIHKKLESLHEYIPKELLPIEYGGSEFTLDELHEKEKDFIMERERRDYLESDHNWEIED